MDKPKNWKSVIVEMQQRTGKEFFLCNIDRNVECKKTHCIKFGGECFLTTNKKYAKQEGES